MAVTVPYGHPDWQRQVEEESRRRSQAGSRDNRTGPTSLQDGRDLRNLSRQGLLDAQGRSAPQAGYTRVGPTAAYAGSRINMGPQDELRARELALADRLNAVATGTQMGAGEMAARREGNRAIAQQQAIARSQRGGGAALAARSAARATGDIGLNTAGQAAQARTQDQQLANQTLSGLLGQARGADIGLATSQAGLSQQAGLANMDAQNQAIFQQAGLNQATSLANMQARLQQTGMNDQAALAYLSQLYGVNVAEMQARLQMELQRQQIQAQKDMSSFGWGDLLQMGGTLGSAYLGRPA